MTPQEQIAYLRKWGGVIQRHHNDAIAAVCDLAERALLTDDEAEAVRAFIAWNDVPGKITAVLRRLLPDERVEHRLVNAGRGAIDTYRPFTYCSCGEKWYDMLTIDAAVRAWAAHAGIGGTE